MSAIDLPTKGGATFYLAHKGKTVTLKHLGLTASGHAFLAVVEGEQDRAYKIDLETLNQEWDCGRLYVVGKQPPWVGASLHC